MNTNSKAATRPQSTASQSPAHKPLTQANKPATATQAPITDRRILLIDARNVLEMFCEAGTQDEYKNSELLSYLEEVKKQVARAESVLKK